MSQSTHSVFPTTPRRLWRPSWSTFNQKVLEGAQVPRHERGMAPLSRTPGTPWLPFCLLWFSRQDSRPVNPSTVRGLRSHGMHRIPPDIRTRKAPRSSISSQNLPVPCTFKPVTRHHCRQEPELKCGLMSPTCHLGIRATLRRRVASSPTACPALDAFLWLAGRHLAPFT